ncbi:G-protein coupled receptor 151 protein-like [Anolis carolinensis]|uniref:G-protein coupled receptor 151 protein-like n=1 Tax=Anolis carolinensis TaxID=28377 RepID=UPI002F2B2545
MNSSRSQGEAVPSGTLAALPALLVGLGLASGVGNLLLAASLAPQLAQGRLAPGYPWLLNLATADWTLGLCRLLLQRGVWLCRASEWLLHASLATKSFSWTAAGLARASGAKTTATTSTTLGNGHSVRSWAGLLASTWAVGLVLAFPRFLFTHHHEEVHPLAWPTCTFQAPHASFVEVFSTVVYPLAACLAPATLALVGYWRALHAPPASNWRDRVAKSRELSRGRQVNWTLLGLTFFFHATWVPTWVAWLWDMAKGTQPPWALEAAAEVLRFLDGALRPALLLVLLAELRPGLRSISWKRSKAEDKGGSAKLGSGATNPEGTPLENLDSSQESTTMRKLPDVENFWKERMSTTAREESDPTPWEHLSEP